MNVAPVLNALEIVLSEELEGKKLLVRELERQERAMVACVPDEVDAATRGVETQVMAEADRARRRDALLARLAVGWGVSVKALTLSSVAERAGDAGARIEELRRELKPIAQDVLRRNRRVARLVGVHQEIAEQTMAAVLGTQRGKEETGVLFDARL